MPQPLLYVQAMSIAAIVSLLCVLAMAGRSQVRNEMWFHAAGLCGMLLGLGCGYGVLGWHWPWPPANGLDRFLIIVVPVTAGVEFLACLFPRARWHMWGCRLAVAALVPRILLHDSVYLTDVRHTEFPVPIAVVWVGSSGLLLGHWWWMLRLSQARHGETVPVSLGLTLLSTGLAIMLAGYLKGGIAAFPFAASLLATTTGVWMHARRTGSSFAPGLSAVTSLGVVGLFGLTFIGCFFGRLPAGSALTLLIAPLLCGVTEFPFVKLTHAGAVNALRLVLVTILLGTVLVIAKRDFDRRLGPLVTHHSVITKSSVGGRAPRLMASSLRQKQKPGISENAGLFACLCDRLLVRQFATDAQPLQ